MVVPLGFRNVFDSGREIHLYPQVILDVIHQRLELLVTVDPLNIESMTVVVS